MAFTARLSEELEAEAKVLADRIGISLNALVSVALRDYLDRPIIPWSGVPSPIPAAVPALSPAVTLPLPVTKPAPLVSQATYRAPKSRSDPCPCGKRNEDGNPLRWKQCHGKTNA